MTKRVGRLPRPTCSHCGAELSTREARFCHACGQPFSSSARSSARKRASRPNSSGSNTTPERVSSVLQRISAFLIRSNQAKKKSADPRKNSRRLDNEQIRQFQYTLRGEKKRINIHLKPSIYRALHQRQPTFNGDYSTYYKQFLGDPSQEKLLLALVKGIWHAAGNADDAARIAISLVQAIPYDEEKANSTIEKDHARYPYEVLFDKCGICGEKSLLLGYLLASFGFETALLRFELESHMAVGILSKPPYTFPNISYAFIESTRPTIATDILARYQSIGLLRSQPTVIRISEGQAFLSLEEEYRDAQMWNQIRNSTSNFSYELSNARGVLIRKYGLM